MSDSRIAEILKAFEVFDGVYKRAHVDAALELQEEIAPHLIGVLEEVLSDPASYGSCPFSRSESMVECDRILCVGLRASSAGRVPFSRWGEGPVQETGERWPFAVQPVPTQR